MKKEMRYLIIGILIVLALFIGYYYREKIIPAPGVDEPPTMHQFFGNVTLPDSIPVEDGTVVYATVRDIEKAMVLTVDGQYGYSSLFIINNILDGETIEFYVEIDGDSKKVSDFVFENFALTELDLVYEEASQPPPVNNGGNGGRDDKGVPYIPPVRVCTEGVNITCGNTDVGECEYGKQTCKNNAWTDCIGAVNPVDEILDDGLDNDCDREIDEGADLPVDVPLAGSGLWITIIIVLSIAILIVGIIIYIISQRKSPELLLKEKIKKLNLNKKNYLQPKA